MPGLSLPAAEHALAAQGDHNEGQAPLLQNTGPLLQVRRSGQQGQLLLRQLDDVHQGQGNRHPLRRLGLVGPEGGAVIGVVAHKAPVFMGRPGGKDGGAAAHARRQADGAEMEDFRPQHRVLVHLLRADIPVRPPEELKAPLPGFIHRDDGHGGGLAPRPQSGGIHAVVFQHPAEVGPEGVVPHLAPKGGFGSQAGRRHRRVGGRPAGVGGELGHPRPIDPGLGQVNQDFANRCHVHDSGLLSFQCMRRSGERPFFANYPLRKRFSRIISNFFLLV